MSKEYTPIFYYDFTRSFNINCFEHDLFFDGQIYRTDCGLNIDSTIFKTHNTELSQDNVKLLVFLCQDYKACEGEFIYEAVIAAEQMITPAIVPPIYASRIRNIYEDYRLCCSALSIYDPCSALTIQILFTNDWIYGYYARDPINKPNWNPEDVCNNGIVDYAAFTSIIPLCKRGNFDPCAKIDNGSIGRLNDFVRVGIGIDINNGTIKYYIDRQEMYTIVRIGYRLADEYQVIDYGGVPYLTIPECMRFGFGHFTFLDHNIPNNYSRQYVIEQLDSYGYPVHRLASGLAQILPTDKYREPYPDFSGTHTSIDASLSFAYSGDDSNMFIFGQGMRTKIMYIAAYVIKTKIEMYKNLCNDAYICDVPECCCNECESGNFCEKSGKCNKRNKSYSSSCESVSVADSTDSAKPGIFDSRDVRVSTKHGDKLNCTKMKCDKMNNKKILDDNRPAFISYKHDSSSSESKTKRKPNISMTSFDKKLFEKNSYDRSSSKSNVNSYNRTLTKSSDSSSSNDSSNDSSDKSSDIDYVDRTLKTISISPATYSLSDLYKMAREKRANRIN